MKKLLLLTMVAVAIVGCSKDGSDSYITAESVTISPSRVELQPGKTTTLRATVLPANVENKTVQWISHNEYVATVDPATGVVTAHALGQATIIAQAENGVSGECTVVVVRDPQEVNRDRAALMDLYNATGGDNWAVNTNWGSDKPLTEWHGVEGPQDTGKIERIDLYMNNLAGEIPASLANLTDLVDINLANNNISGPLPATLGTLPKLKYLAVFGNRMSGKIPASVTQNADLWNNCWAHIIMENNFDIDEVNAKATLFDVVDMDGGRIVAAEEYAENEYTALLQFGPSYWEGVETLKELYNKYKDQGFDIIGYASLGLDLFSAGEVRDFVEQNEFPWRNVLWDEDNLIHEIDPMWSLRNYYPYYSLPFVTVVDSSGDIAFYSDNLDKENQGLEIFLDEKLGGVAPPQYYTSTDYSADGRVSKLQSATEGDGIDVVMMGDAFSDRMIANGTYERVMRDAMEYLFVEEPYKSHRAMFNVYMVDVVSPNEGYEYGMKTALDTWFGDMTLVGGDDYDVTDYTRMALSEERMDEAMTIVIMNSTEYSGTCYLYYPSREGDYGSGYSISYFPMGSNKQVFRELLNHEANGHGFSKLADEYFYEEYGAMPESEKTGFREVSEKFGWNKNVDLTGDPTLVKWAKFISDSRYAGQGLGTFEGAATYFRGAWRPTDNSIMNDNTGGFNAPSRESIYYKMHKMAYGLGWHYYYEEFVAWDLSHRTRAAEGVSATRGVGVLRPSTPPVVRPYTWRELKPAGR